MYLLDTDIMIDIHRGYPPTLLWLDTLNVPVPVISGFVIMELLDFGGVKNKNALQKH